jgi:hypothetical protein
MLIKIDKDSYKSSNIFGYITQDLLYVKTTYDENMYPVLNSIELKDKQLESKRAELIGEYIEGDLFDIQLDQIKNNHLRTFLFNGALIYYYSQFEIKLHEICIRLPILIDCAPITDFKSKKNGKIDKISEYLSEYADVNIKQTGNWQKISDFSKIRHSITHTEIISKDKKQEYISVANNNKGKVFYNTLSNTLEIELSYLSEIIDISYNFTERIIIEIWKKHH